MAERLVGILLTALLIQTFVGIAVELDRNPTSYSWNYLLGQSQVIESQENQVNSEEGIFGEIKSAISQLYQSTVGSGLRFGKAIWDLVTAGLNPFSISYEAYDNVFEQTLAIVLIFIRSLIVGLTIVYIFVVFILKRGG